MEEAIRRLVYACLQREGELLETLLDLSQAADAPLYGEQGQLDSMSLVALIVSLEQEIQEQFGVALVLADEKAMSARRSPFATVGSLCAHIGRLLEEQQCQLPSR